jgi:hypothetical protein
MRVAKDFGGASQSCAGATAARASLLEAERELGADSASEGTARALIARADETFRLYRQNSFPFVGKEAAREALEGKADFTAWKVFGASASDDLGYAYGTYGSRSKPADEKPVEQGNYARIWRRQGGAWRVLLDVTNPVRPQ